MDRVELRKYFDEVQASALKWYEESARAVEEAELCLDEIRAQIKSKKRADGGYQPSDEELALVEEAKAVLKEARAELTFFDGVKKGIDMTVNPIRKAMANEELANAGKFIPKSLKPRRR